MEKTELPKDLDVTRLTAGQLEAAIKKAASNLEFLHFNVRVHMTEAAGHREFKDYTEAAVSTRALKMRAREADQTFRDATLAMQELVQMGRTYPKRLTNDDVPILFEKMKEYKAAVDRMRIKNGG